MNHEEFHSLIADTQENICQITALKNGVTLINDTWHEYKTTDTVNVMSATKSVASLLVGIALDKNFIKSINQPLLDFFPDYTIKWGEKTIQQVTIRHLLTMTAPYKYKSEPWTKVCSSDDWTIAALDLLGGRADLTGQFKYSTLGIHILTGILAKTSGLFRRRNGERASPISDCLHSKRRRKAGRAVRTSYKSFCVLRHQLEMVQGYIKDSEKRWEYDAYIKGWLKDIETTKRMV